MIGKCSTRDDMNKRTKKSRIVVTNARLLWMQQKNKTKRALRASLCRSILGREVEGLGCGRKVEEVGGGRNGVTRRVMRGGREEGR